MNPSEQEIENILRHAPRPKPPAGLKNELLAQVKLPSVRSESLTTVMVHPHGAWFRRWWPALAPATVSLACVVVLTVQQMEIGDLRESISVFSAGATTADPVPSVAIPAARNDTPAVDSSTLEQQEIARLKQVASQLAAEVARLERTRKENDNLRVQLATPPGLTAEELDALAKALERALRIQCVNNLKQFGLAARQWALDHNDVNPPDVICMSNELNTPKLLVCPAETNRPAATSWATYTSANCSYEYLAASGSYKEEPTRVLSRCPIHGTIGLCDGSVQGVAKNHPDWFVQRDGKLYYEPRALPEVIR